MRDTPTPSIDVLALLRERRYLVLLIIVAILAVPIAAAAYWFLYLVSDMQKWVFNPAYLPKALGFHGEPTWWPLPMLTLVRCPRRVDHQVLARPGGGAHPPTGSMCTGRRLVNAAQKANDCGPTQCAPVIAHVTAGSLTS